MEKVCVCVCVCVCMSVRARRRKPKLTRGGGHVPEALGVVGEALGGLVVAVRNLFG